jgi:hypothetical protein
MRRWVIPCLLMWITTGCSADGKPAEFTSPITSEALDAFRSLTSDGSILTITSTGGDTLTAIKVGRLIRDRDVTLVVRGFCLSACAQFIAPAARKLVFEGLPIFAMHHSATALGGTLRASGDDRGAAFYDRVAAEEQRFYKDMGFREELLTYPFSLIEPVCVGPADELTSRPAGVMSKWGFSILSRPTYQRLVPDQELEGRWAESSDEVMATARQFIPPTASLLLKPEWSYRDKPSAAVRRLQPCA